MKNVLTIRIGHDIGNTPNALATPRILETAQYVLKQPGFTTWEAFGYWRGAFEQTTVIEIAGLDTETAEKLFDKLPDLADALEQTSVYGTITRAKCAERFASEAEEQSKTA